MHGSVESGVPSEDSLSLLTLEMTCYAKVALHCMWDSLPLPLLSLPLSWRRLGFSREIDSFMSFGASETIYFYTLANVTLNRTFHKKKVALQIRFAFF